MSAPGGRIERVVVAGFGMAGGRLLTELLERHRREAGRGGADSPGRITVLGSEAYPSYNRVLLTDVLAGRADVTALGLLDPGRCADQAGTGLQVDVRVGVGVRRVELPAGECSGTVLADDGARVPFDRLVLATGADAVLPPVQGIGIGRRARGVHTLRNVDDVRAILAGVGGAKTAAVLGGGLLGLEAACALATRGLEVHLLSRGQRLLPELLDETASAVLTRSLRRLGVQVHPGVQVDRVVARCGWVSEVRLTDTELRCVPADLLVVACGVRPRTDLAVSVDLQVRTGVVVDDRLATSDPRVLAIGDCAEHRGATPGLLAPAWEQARVAAALLSGADPRAHYAGHGRSVRLKAAGVELCVVGEADAPLFGQDDGPDVVQYVDPCRGRYVKIVSRRGRMSGAAVIGDPRVAAEARLLVERGAPVPADPACLLQPEVRGRSAAYDTEAVPVGDQATICRCNGVTRGALTSAWSDGARSTAELARRTRAGTGCGTCTDLVTRLVRSLDGAAPVAARPTG